MRIDALYSGRGGDLYFLSYTYPMLPKKLRSTTKDFKMKPVRTKNAENIRLSVRQVEKDELSRFGVVVPKSVSKKAVERNRIKRRIYAGLQNYPTFKQKGYLYVFQATNKALLTMPFSEIKSEIDSLLN